MKKKNNLSGFTLIELLVVVLIIGILASIALPAYQTAVNKSRYAGLMPLARSVKNAEEEIFMSKGDYTADLQDLSVQVPGNLSEQGDSVTNEDGVTIQVVSNKKQDFVKASKTNLDNALVMYFDKSARYPGQIHCEALTTNPKAQQLCQSYGPVSAVTGTSGDVTAYVLEGDGTNEGLVRKSVEDTIEPTCTTDKWGDVTNCIDGRRTYDDGSYVERWWTCYSVPCDEIQAMKDDGQYINVYDKDGNYLSSFSVYGSGNKAEIEHWIYDDDEFYESEKAGGSLQQLLCSYDPDNVVCP